MSDLIVATAALEIGYNDPDVGAVMQHKAPRDWAAFLQRRGRAGRRRVMRPWTTVVLSDYGRDRLAYQAYEQLFDPELPQRSLPVGNRYVLRMQATFALMDWLSSRMPQTLPLGSIWQDLSGPAIGTGWWVENLRRRHEWVQNVLLELIEGVPDTCSFPRTLPSGRAGDLAGGNKRLSFGTRLARSTLPSFRPYSVVSSRVEAHSRHIPTSQRPIIRPKTIPSPISSRNNSSVT